MRRACLLLLTLLSSPAWATDNSVLITTVPAQQGEVPETLAAYGTVQAGLDGTRSLSLLRAGQVEQVFVLPSQTVRMGDRLLEIQVDPASLAGYEQAVTALNLARGERARAQQMLAQHLATRDQLAVAEKAVTDAQANLDALRRAGGGSATETLKAPFDGFVVAIPVAQGQRVQAQASLLVLWRTDRLAVSVGIEPSAHVRVQVGQPARLEPLDGGSSVEGTVASVGAMVDPQTHLVPTLIDVPQAGLMPGASVRAVVQIGRMQGWLVSRPAVLSDGKGAYVFQVADGKAARVDVRILGHAGDTTVVDGPLDPARPVIGSGNYQLQDGMVVREASPGSVQAVSSARTPATP